MCGIFAILTRCSGQTIINGCCENGSTVKVNNKKSKCDESLRELAYRHSTRQRHRGPDYTGVYVIRDDAGVMIHERMAVVGVKTGIQPLINASGDVILIAVGEIYNYLEIASRIRAIRGEYEPRGDCDVILAAYEEYGVDLFNHITGMFAFMIYDERTRQVLIGRDPIGIIPLYMGEDELGNLWVASEMKCFVEKCYKVESFAPGFYKYGKVGDLKSIKYWNPQWMTTIPKTPTNLTILREKLESAVESHLQCDVPFAALLSGGVDSSLIAAMATKIMRKRRSDFRLKTYSVGLKDAPDFVYSKKVADYIQSDHTEVVFTIEQGLDCIRDIIFHLETYDITSVRASIPMAILSRYIKSEGIKMILSGEGADEIFGGYLYFHNSPSYEEFHKETVSRVSCLHYSDCLRANKSTMAWGLELRVPFLDTHFVNYSMTIAPEDRIPGVKNRFYATKQHLPESKMEKYILRAAFADDYIPYDVLWRQKEQFSDGVGYGWIDAIRLYAESHVSDEEMSMASVLYPINTPTTKEAFYYRRLFNEIFPGDAYAKTVMKWIPRTDWGCSSDPSGRAQKVHAAHQ